MKRPSLHSGSCARRGRPPPFVFSHSNRARLYPETLIATIWRSPIGHSHIGEGYGTRCTGYSKDVCDYRVPIATHP